MLMTASHSRCTLKQPWGVVVAASHVEDSRFWQFQPFALQKGMVSLRNTVKTSPEGLRVRRNTSNLNIFKWSTGSKDRDSDESVCELNQAVGVGILFTVLRSIPAFE